MVIKIRISNTVLTFSPSEKYFKEKPLNGRSIVTLRATLLIILLGLSLQTYQLKFSHIIPAVQLYESLQ